MMINSVDSDEKVISRTKDCLGRENTATFLTENGLYEVLMLSRKPVAKEFKKEVKKILKTIRTTGKYTVVPTKSKEEIDFENNRIKLEKANILLRLSDKYKTKYQTYSEILDAYATKEISGEFLLPLPKTEKTYSATEIAKELNVSPNKIGKIANENHLKTDEFGIYVLDKSKYSTKEVQTFRYNEKGFNVLKDLVKGA